MRKVASLLTMLMLFSALAFAQTTHTVTGQVKDDKGDGVVNATISETSTPSNKAKADVNGFFTIKIKAGSQLTITSTGYQPKTVTPGMGTGLQTFDLVTNVKENAEVVVTTALGIKKRPKELGYSQTTVKADQIVAGKSPRLGQALSGKVAGLTVYNTSASVNASPRIVLRGNRSITGDNTALVVLDGVPVPANTINYLNTNDIESVTILKGGQAATLYGSDGVNGALMINTKQGGGKPQINFQSTVNFENVSFLPDFQEEFGSGSDYGLTVDENFRPFENQQYGPRYDGLPRSAGRVLENGDYQVYPYANIEGIRKKYWNTGVSVTNDISISGGDANSKIFMSIQDANIKGIVPKDTYRRDQLRFNATKTYGKFRAGFDGTFAFDRAKRTTVDYYFLAMNSASWVPIDKLKDWQTNPFANPNGYFNDYYNNPWFELDNNRTDQRNNYFNGNLNLYFKPLPWLELSYRLGSAITNSFQKDWTGRFDYSQYAQGRLGPKPVTHDPQYNDYSYVYRSRTPIPGRVADASSYGWRINSDFIMTLSKDWGDISTKLLLGNNVQDRKSKSLNVSSTSIVIPGVLNVANRAGLLGGGESNTQLRKIGNYADLTVGYKDWVFLHASVRNDQSSVFFKKTRDSKLYSYTYPGVDISFILTDALPTIKSDVLNFLKVRASYNKNGNDNTGSLGSYPLDPTFSNGGGFPYGSLVGATVDNTLPDPSLGPEFVYSKEVGFEAQFWKNRINLDASYFTQDAKRQVMDVLISSATGYMSTTLNAGRVFNKGFEAELRANIFRTKNWNIDINANYTYSTNEVKSLFGGLTNLQLNTGGAESIISAVIGQPFPLLRTTYYAIDSASGGTIVNPADGWPIMGTGLKTQGTTLPKHQLGLGFKVAYKWVSLSANAEYRGGHVIYNNVGKDLSFTGSSATTTLYHRQQFIWPNSVYFDGSKYVPNTNIVVDNHIAIYQGWGDLSFSRGIRFNGDWFTTSAAFWKVRDVSLNFDLPQAWYARLKGIKSVGVSFFGRNLFMWLPKENIYADPEFAAYAGGANANGIGLAGNNTPPVRQYGATLNIIF